MFTREADIRDKNGRSICLNRRCVYAPGLVSQLLGDNLAFRNYFREVYIAEAARGKASPFFRLSAGKSAYAIGYVISAVVPEKKDYLRPRSWNAPRKRFPAGRAEFSRVPAARSPLIRLHGYPNGYYAQ